MLFSGQLNDLEEMLHHKNIKIKGQNVDSANNMVIRELQEELSNARTQLDRWKNEAIQGKFKFFADLCFAGRDDRASDDVIKIISFVKS